MSTQTLLVQIQPSQYIILHFAVRMLAATGIPQGLSGQGQAGRTNPIIPARSTGGSSISGYGVSLWGWARPSHNGSLAWWDPWPGINYFSLFCLVKTNPLFYWLLGPKKYISYFPLPFSCFKTPFFLCKLQSIVEETSKAPSI